MRLILIQALFALVALAAWDAAEAEKRGIGWLVDYCDDDWTIMPKQYFYGRCQNNVGAREDMYIDLDGCYTVTNNGQLAIDNLRQCTDLDLDACLMCRCYYTTADGNRHRAWMKTDMDDPVYVDTKNSRLCCGEWWGRPYCGEPGKPPKPARPGLLAYDDELPDEL
ncbi:hypothetical protein BX600DRAFT_518442 [Xylariales sp. PMI_506]|nr:hypothetical protein BX600DRAFT_518442 [Xylariales sp. PMI_506]